MNGNEWWKNPALAPFFQQPAPQDATQQDVIGGNRKTGYTGRGADGIIQTDRRVPGAGNGRYDAHESEFVLNANVTQAIGPDVLQGLQKGAEEGTLDVNKLREVIGQPAKQSFQKGGMAPATVQQPAQAQTTIPTQPRQAQPSPTPAPESKKPRPPLFGMGKPRPPKEVGATGIMTPDTIPSPDLAKTVPDLNLMTGIDQIEGATAKFPGKPGPQATPPAKPLPPAGALGEGGTFPTKPIAEIPTGQYSEEGVKPPSKAIQAPKVKAFGEGGIFPAEDIPNAVSDIPQLLPETVDQLNQNGISMDDVLKYMQGIMDGSNPYFQMIKDLLMQDIGGAGAAGTAAMKQEARQRGWSEGQIASLGVSRQRDVEAIGSQALGKLATEQAKMGLQAAKDLFGMELQKAQFDFAKEKYGDLEGQQIAQDINAGMTWNQIKEKYPNMTIEDYNSMKDASPLGQQAWNKQLDAINMLLGAGGEENFKNAADMLNKMFPGMDIDFSNAINAENAQNFSQGMGNMASYIASGLSWEDAFKAMQEDGTLDLLGMTESDIESMYNKLMLNQNPILQAEQTYQQLLDSGVINQEEFDEMMEFLTWGLTHPEGVDISGGYSVFDKQGNEIQFFKTEEEMNEWIDDNPGDYNTEFVENHIQTKMEGPPGSGGLGGIDTTTAEYQRVKELLGRDPTAEEMTMMEGGGNVADVFLRGAFSDLAIDDLDEISTFYDRMPDDWKEKNSLTDVITKMGNISDIDPNYFDGKDKSDAAYQALLKDADTNSFTGKTHTTGSGSTERRVFDDMPKVGGYLQRNGTAFQLVSKETVDNIEGRLDGKKYKLKNMITGETFWVKTWHSEGRLEELFEKYS